MGSVASVGSGQSTAGAHADEPVVQRHGNDDVNRAAKVSDLAAIGHLVRRVLTTNGRTPSIETAPKYPNLQTASTPTPTEVVCNSIPPSSHGNSKLPLEAIWRELIDRVRSQLSANSCRQPVTVIVSKTILQQVQQGEFEGKLVTLDGHAKVFSAVTGATRELLEGGCTPVIGSSPKTSPNAASHTVTVNSSPSVHLAVPKSTSSDKPELHWLIYALTEKRDLFQFVSRKSHATGSNTVGPHTEIPLINQLQKALEASGDKPIELGEGFQLTAISDYDGAQSWEARQEHGIFCKKVALTIKKPDGSTQTIHLTQVAPPFVGRKLKADDLRKVHAIYKDALQAPGGAHSSSSVARKPPVVFSYSGFGRNASLAVYDELVTRIESGDITDDDTLQSALAELTESGKLVRGIDFVQSKAQFHEIYTAAREVLSEKKAGPESALAATRFDSKENSSTGKPENSEVGVKSVGGDDHMCAPGTVPPPNSLTGAHAPLDDFLTRVRYSSSDSSLTSSAASETDFNDDIDSVAGDQVNAQKAQATKYHLPPIDEVKIIDVQEGNSCGRCAINNLFQKMTVCDVDYLKVLKDNDLLLSTHVGQSETKKLNNYIASILAMALPSAKTKLALDFVSRHMMTTSALAELLNQKIKEVNDQNDKKNKIPLFDVMTFPELTHPSYDQHLNERMSALSRILKADSTFGLIVQTLNHYTAYLKTNEKDQQQKPIWLRVESSNTNSQSPLEQMTENDLLNRIRDVAKNVIYPRTDTPSSESASQAPQAQLDPRILSWVSAHA